MSAIRSRSSTTRSLARATAGVSAAVALSLPFGAAAGSETPSRSARDGLERRAFEIVVRHVDGLIEDLGPDALAIIRAHAQRTQLRLERIESRQEAILRRFDGSAGPPGTPVGSGTRATAPRPGPPPRADAPNEPADPGDASPAPTAPVESAKPAASPPLAPEERSTLISEAVRSFGASLDEAGRKHDLEARFLLCVMNVESAFHPEAVSKAGAIGLLQLMPATAAELGANPWDLRQNIFAGAGLIDSHLKRYGEDVALAMAAYNAGPGAVDRHKGVPPYPDTREYVARITRECGAPRPPRAASQGRRPEMDRRTR